MRTLKFLRLVLFASVFIVALAISASAVSVGTVNASALRLRASDSTASSILTTVSRGEQVLVLSDSGSWCKVSYNYTEGYMYKDYLNISDSCDEGLGSGVITASVLNVRGGPSTGYGVVGQLREGTVVDIGGLKSGWYQISYGSTSGYVHPDYLSLRQDQTASRSAATGGSSSDTTSLSTADVSSSSEIRQDIVAYAKNFIGTRYVYGGASPSGFDCSGLVYYVFKQHGYSLSRTASAQYGCGTKISKSELQPGDLVFFTYYGGGSIQHSGIYIGGGQFIHSVKPGDTVRITSMNDSYYLSNYYGACRILP